MKIVLLLTLILVAGTVSLGVYALKCGIDSKKAKKFLGANMGTFALIMIGATLFLLGGNSAAAADTATSTGVTTGEGLQAVGAALSTGLAAIGAGIAVASTGSSAIGAISEDPKLLGRTLIFVGLGEGIAIYGLIISIIIIAM